MSALPTLPHISIEAYLADELRSDVKHEYLGGTVYAMAGAKNVHNVIATNLVGAIHGRLRGKPCQAMNSDTKVRVKMSNHTRFYYPDGMVVCSTNPPDDSFQDSPKVLAEVLSDSTRRVDEGEKRDAYLTIPSLDVYLLIDSSRARVVAYRRGEQGFAVELYEGLDKVVALGEVEAELPLGELYERVTFEAEGDEGEGSSA